MDEHSIIVIGTSAGGVEALKALFSTLPADMPAAIFGVLHIRTTLDSHLPQILNRVSRMPVLHPQAGEPVVPGKIYVAPPDKHMILENGRILLTTGPKENRHRPAIDPLFRSAALEYGPRVIGVILTGILDDGTVGLWEIKRRGGIAIVQDPADAPYPNMALSAINNVAVDYILPVEQIGDVLVSLCTNVGGLRKRK